MGLDKLADISIVHPLRCHRELVRAHRHSQERQHILMVKGLPCHNLFTERLRGSQSVGHPGLRIARRVTHTCDLVEVARHVYHYNFDRDFAPLVFTLPHVGVPTAVQWGVRPVVA